MDGIVTSSIGQFFGGLDKLIGGAERLGTLSAAGIWAFFTLVLIAYLFLDLRRQQKASQIAWNARLEEVKGEALVAAALERMADEIKELRHYVTDNGGK